MTERRLTLVAGIQQSVHWLVMGTMIPVMTLIKTSQGITLFQVGVSVAVYSATTMLLLIHTGGLADRIGPRKTYVLSMAFAMFTGTGRLHSRIEGQYVGLESNIADDGNFIGNVFHSCYSLFR